MARNMSIAATVPLSDAPIRQPAAVRTVDWAALSEGEIRRLREFGLDEGVEVEILHRSMFGRGPLACRIGRMTIAIRAHVAHAIHVEAKGA
jgi:ferrous iron transport protein A